MTGRICHFLVLVTFVGCAERHRDPGSLVVIPGQGIPKIAELGMTLAEIQKAAGDLQMQPYPESGLPWTKNSIGDRRRLFWEKPLHVTGVSRSLGLAVSEHNDDKPVRILIFFSDPDPFMVDSNTWFTGRLSNGISFANRQRVTRAEVTAVFGEPAVHRVDLGKEEYRLVQEGTSVSAKSSNSNGVENLFYPTNGIGFCLRHDLVISFSVREKVQRPAK